MGDDNKQRVSILLMMMIMRSDEGTINIDIHVHHGRLWKKNLRATECNVRKELEYIDSSTHHKGLHNETFPDQRLFKISLSLQKNISYGPILEFGAPRGRDVTFFA